MNYSERGQLTSKPFHTFIRNNCILMSFGNGMERDKRACCFCRERAAIKGRIKREPARLSLRHTLLSNPLATHPHVMMKNAAVVIHRSSNFLRNNISSSPPLLLTCFLLNFRPGDFPDVGALKAEFPSSHP